MFFATRMETLVNVNKLVVIFILVTVCCITANEVDCGRNPSLTNSTVESRFKKGLNLQIHLHKNFFFCSRFWPRFYIVVLGMTFFCQVTSFFSIFFWTFISLLFPFFISFLFSFFISTFVSSFVSNFVILFYFFSLSFHIPFYPITVWFWISSKFLNLCTT